jgi:AcrR family transcriptional regulator
VEIAVKAQRPYRAKLREEQANLTRQRILAAARTLFVGRGFAQVTMQDVAREADVAYQTLYSQFGNKGQLALELCTSEMLHMGQAVAMLSEGHDAGNPVEWLRLMGSFARRLYEPCAEVLRFMRESGDPDLINRYREMGRRRSERLADLGPQLEASGCLRPGLTAQQAVALVWSMTSPEIYEQLVLDQGWTSEQFEAWLGPALADLVLAS